MNTTDILQTARQKHHAGRLDEAEQGYREVLGGEPAHPDALHLLGLIALQQGRYEEALERIDQALEIRPNFSRALNNRGAALREIGRIEEALASFRRACELDPKFADALYNLGTSLYLTNRTEQAIDALQRAVELKPEASEYPCHLGAALLRRGDAAGALAAADRSLSVAPGNTRGLSLRATALVEAGDAKGAAGLLDYERFVRPIRIQQAPGYSSVSAFNDALCEHVLAHPSLVSDPTGHATRNGMHTGELLSEPKGPMSTFEQIIGEAVSQYRASLQAGHPFTDAAPRHHVVTAWGVVMRAQGHQIPHDHPSAWLSGVYYPRIPEVIRRQSNRQAGWIEFGRPPEVFNCRATPRLHILTPEEGLLVLFPAYIYHRTIPYETDEMRVSIAFDVVPVGRPVGTHAAPVAAARTQVTRPMNITDILQTARQKHHAGRLDEAEQGYREVLDGAPAHPDALHLLGVIALQQGRFEEALERIDQALEIRPNFSQAFNNRGAALREIGRIEEALASYRRATELDPLFADAFYNLGTGLYLMDHTEQAIEALQRAVELEPAMAEAHLNLGTALRRLQRYDASDEALRQALAVNPSFAEAHCNLGANENARGHYDAAIAHLRKAIALNPDFFDAWYNLANGLLGNKMYDEAVEGYRRCLALKPDFAMANAKLVEALARKGDTEAAEAAYREGMDLVLSIPESAYEVGVTRLRRGDAASALQAADRSLAVRPGYTRGLSLRAFALAELGERAAAEELLDFERLVRLVEIGPETGVPDIVAFNTALTSHVLQHPTLSSDPEGHATKEGQHSGELLMEPKGPMSTLEGVLGAQVRAYRDWVRTQSGHPFLVNPPERFGLTAWGVVMRAQGHQIPHNHPSAWLSAVYYAKVPPVVTEHEETRSGWLEFGRPPESFNCRAEHPTYTLQPREGRLVLFPSYLYHRTIPYQADELRVSIAFDAVPIA